MSNAELWLVYLFFDFTIALLLMRFYGKIALYAIIISGLILCNFQVLKLVDIFGYSVSLGNITYGSIFLATDLLSECYGKKEAKNAINIALICLLFIVIGLKITALFTPSAADVNSDMINSLANVTPRVAVASLLAYFISQYHDIWAFDFWKNITRGKHLWVRNNLSTLASQLLDTSIFVGIAFIGIYPNNVVITIFFTTLLIKWIIAILDTPMVYLGRYILRKHI